MINASYCGTIVSAFSYLHQKVGPRQVAFAGVGQQHNNHFARHIGVLGDLGGGVRRRAAGLPTRLLIRILS